MKNHLSRLFRNSKSVYELLENLFTWSSIQRENFVLEREKVNLKEIIDEIFEVFLERASMKEMKLTNSFPDNVIIYTDKDALKTIIRNLTSNAIKFTETDGEVLVSGLTDGASVEISVKDTGVGMNDDDLRNLFTIHSKKKKKGTKGEQGTGLGLLICNQLLKKMGGSIDVKSSLGRGSEFIITLLTSIPP